MGIAIVKGLLDEIVAIAAADTNEVCGLLLGSEGRISAILPCANLAPDPARRFEIDPAALIAAHRAARGGRARIVGHYHSHPTGLAIPSARDAADAIEDGVIWLIVADDVVRAWRTVRDGGVEGRFDECRLREVPADTEACVAAPPSPQGARNIGE